MKIAGAEALRKVHHGSLNAIQATVGIAAKMKAMACMHTLQARIVAQIQDGHVDQGCLVGGTRPLVRQGAGDGGVDHGQDAQVLHDGCIGPLWW